jgi:hypothetical protein
MKKKYNPKTDMYEDDLLSTRFAVWILLYNGIVKLIKKLYQKWSNRHSNE